MKKIWPRFLHYVAAALVASAAPADAAPGDLPVDVELVLAVDASFSVGGREQDIQRIGYVAAFRDPQVVAALTGGPHGRSAVAYVEWADEGFQHLVVEWTLIEAPADAATFAARLKSAPIRRSGSTSLSRALAYSAALFAGNGFAGERLVIDISGDGANNDGPPVDEARDAVASLGITVNGLPLLTKEADASPVDLADYFAGCVIGGVGAFSHAVDKSDDIPAAIRRKMVMELAGLPVVPAEFHVASRGAGDVDCLVGERMRREEYIRMLRTMTPTPERWAPDEETWPTPRPRARPAE